MISHIYFIIPDSFTCSYTKPNPSSATKQTLQGKQQNEVNTQRVSCSFLGQHESTANYTVTVHSLREETSNKNCDCDIDIII